MGEHKDDKTVYIRYDDAWQKTDRVKSGGKAIIGQTTYIFKNNSQWTPIAEVN